jgi:hypothetical protein
VKRRYPRPEVYRHGVVDSRGFVHPFEVGADGEKVLRRVGHQGRDA